jgi:hypothetical protein
MERPGKQTTERQGVCESALKLCALWEGDQREAKVRTGRGKAHRPGSQGGLRKRGPWWNEAPTSRIERARVGNSPPTVVRAADLSRPSFRLLNQSLGTPNLASWSICINMCIVCVCNAHGTKRSDVQIYANMGSILSMLPPCLQARRSPSRTTASPMVSSVSSRSVSRGRVVVIAHTEYADEVHIISMREGTKREQTTYFRSLTD